MGAALRGSGAGGEGLWAFVARVASLRNRPSNAAVPWPSWLQQPATGGLSTAGALQAPRRRRQPPSGQQRPLGLGSTRLLAAAATLQDKGKRPLHEDSESEDDAEEDESEHQQQQQQRPEEEDEQPSSSSAGAASAAEDQGCCGGLAAEDSEPGDLTCAICLHGIPLENLALVKVGAGCWKWVLAQQRSCRQGG